MQPTATTRLERKKEITTQKIISAAMRLFVEQGVDSTTMEQIAAQVDVAKGTLYNYFPVKEAIIDEYIKRSFAERSTQRQVRLRKLPDTRSRMIAILDELMEGVRAQHEIFEKYFVYRIQNMLSLRQDERGNGSGFFPLEADLIELGQNDGEIRTDLPLEILTGLFEFVFVKVAQRYYQAPAQFKSRQIIEQCVDLFMNGVAVKYRVLLK